MNISINNLTLRVVTHLLLILVVAANFRLIVTLEVMIAIMMRLKIMK